MKNIVLIATLFILTGVIYTQNIYTWDRYSVSFEAPFKLDIYETESIEVFGSDNDNYAVDISGFDLKYYNDYAKRSDIKITAFEMAKAYGFTNIKDGGVLPNIVKGYYVIAGTSAIKSESDVVVFVVAVDEERKHYLEGTIYCYDKNESNGIKIAKTFQFLK